MLGTKTLALCVVALAAASHVEAFVSTPAALRAAGPGLRGACTSSARCSRTILKMDVDTKKDGVKAGNKKDDSNLCDMNTQLCDGESHSIMDGSTKKEEEGGEKKESMMTKVKAAGLAGIISYALWEFIFWTVSAPAAIVVYHQTTGEWPNFNNPESTAKVSAVIFGFLNFARALVPVRIGLTLATAPLVDKYIVKPFNLKKEDQEEDKQ